MQDLLQKIARAWKTVLATLPLATLVVGEAIQAAENGASDGTFDVNDVVMLVVAALTPILVYAKANTTTDPVVAATQSVQLEGGSSRLV